MKKHIFFLMVLLAIAACSTQQYTPDIQPDSISFEKGGDNEYDILVSDADYEIYMQSQAKPMNFYSEDYYKMKNERYVSEWNYRNGQPNTYNPNFYILPIDYNPRTEYGIKFEYRLYNFFKFIEWKYKIKF